jgi:uncharacterized membrane protein (DUF2068 family)
MTNPPADRLLQLIALGKFAKSALLITLGLAALHLINPAAAERLQTWARDLFSHHRLPQAERLASMISSITPRRMEAAGLVCFAYAALFLTEGTGLWLRKRWAEYLTTIATSSLIPFELYEITRNPTSLRILLLAINLAIVAYLIHCIRRDKIQKTTEPQKTSEGSFS